jgi:flagellar assembly protein FliH
MPKIIKTDFVQTSSVSSFERLPLVPEEAHNGHLSLAEAAEVLARAHAEAAAVTEAAFNEGLRRGMEEGERRFRESIRESVEVLRSAATRVDQSHKEFLDQIEPQLIRLAASIASKIIERESSLSGDLVQRTVRAALEKIVDEEQVVVRVNPKDLDTLRKYRTELTQEFDSITRIDVVPDASIDAGGCIAQTDSVRVDGRLASQLEKILNELLG